MSGLFAIKDSTADGGGGVPTQPDNLWNWTGDDFDCINDEICNLDADDNWEFVGTVYPIYGYPQITGDNVKIYIEEEDSEIILIAESINSLTLAGYYDANFQNEGELVLAFVGDTGGDDVM